MAFGGKQNPYCAAEYWRVDRVVFIGDEDSVRIDFTGYIDRKDRNEAREHTKHSLRVDLAAFVSAIGQTGDLRAAAYVCAKADFARDVDAVVDV